MKLQVSDESFTVGGKSKEVTKGVSERGLRTWTCCELVDEFGTSSFDFELRRD